MGLNIKGQLGLSHFENVNTPKLVLNLIPYAGKNHKTLTPQQLKPPKSPVV
jgi:hypothetical protein